MAVWTLTGAVNETTFGPELAVRWQSAYLTTLRSLDHSSPELEAGQFWRPCKKKTLGGSGDCFFEVACTDARTGVKMQARAVFLHLAAEVQLPGFTPWHCSPGLVPSTRKQGEGKERGQSYLPWGLKDPRCCCVPSSGTYGLMVQDCSGNEFGGGRLRLELLPSLPSYAAGWMQVSQQSWGCNSLHGGEAESNCRWGEIFRRAVSPSVG